MENCIKRIKLHAKHRDLSNRTSRDVPWLNVNGLWLERADFGIGQKVEINIADSSVNNTANNTAANHASKSK